MKRIPKQVDIKSAYIQDAYEALEQELMELLIKRLNAKTTVELSNDTVFQWQLEKLQQLRMMNMDTIEELVTKTSGVTQTELRDLITNQGYDFNVEANRELANLVGGPVSEWSNLDLILNQYFDSQWLDLDNHINQTLISTNYQHNSLAKAYQQVLNDTVTKTLTGLQTSEQAFKSAVYEMVEKGIASSFTDKGGREWSLERYVRTVIKSTTRRVYNDLRTERAISQYNIVTALMSSHAAARDACAPIQGKFVLMVPTNEAPPEYQHLPSVYDHGWKEPAGCNGINCNHRWYSMLPMDNTGIPKPPKPQEAQENAKTVAKQRRMEVAIRKAKKQLRAAELLDDEVGQEYFKMLIRKRQGALRQLIDDNKDLLHRSYGRESVLSNPSSSVIKGYKETIEQDRKDYKNYVRDLGQKNFTYSFEEYRDMVYNNPKEYGLLQDYAKSRSANMISVFSSFSDYTRYKNRIEKEIVGLTTSDGIEIRSQSKHFIERVLGTTSDPKTNKPRNGVTISEIKKTLLNGESLLSNQSETVMRYYGDKCRVTVNVKTGNLIQVNPI